MAARCMNTCTHLNTPKPSGVSTGTRTVDKDPPTTTRQGLTAYTHQLYWMGCVNQCRTREKSFSS